MPSEQTHQALLDIRDNIYLAREFTTGFDETTFAEDRRTFYATTRCLEIISEAVRRLESALHDRHPDQPWKKIMAAGNIYRHNYDNVAERFVWFTVKDSLSSLLAIIENELQHYSKG